ncbi:chemotaxis protein CheB [Amycolatopsis sp. DG1A-15b]|uniref:chemotaxis protein CheB n=1 Tax=Amycolatopsis sp. DG1A-15b TaxID=3052846 RepID=UPI00255BF566|nr:chemotaxis protein CheB [Amycolatopsis sp. DG1A-15b]WIX90711.1 chemotaxis protein CheB [Amycolatopsis sp. DG1A-15b]
MRGRREVRVRRRGEPVTPDFPLRFPVVALVTSAGGLEALTRVLAPLPADFPAAVLVAQHLEPARTSHLTEILAARTALRVGEAADGDVLVAGAALVVPAGRHLLVTSAARIGLLDTASCRRRKGTDAQAGIRAIAHCGGTVFAQDEGTSAHFGMPGAAIGTGLVHAVLPLSGIGAAILDHVARHA